MLAEVRGQNEQLRPRRPLDGGRYQPAVRPACLDALDGGVGGAGAVRGEPNDGIGVVAERHRDRRQPHQRPVTRAHPVHRRAVRLAAHLELLHGGPGPVADVEALPRAAEIPVAVPADEPGELVEGIVSPGLRQASRDAQRHRRVVGPLPGREVEHPAARHAGDGREGVASLELDGGAQRITHREPEETTQQPVAPCVTDRHAPKPR